MKRAFTLVEMLIVVTVISILMTIVVRFGNLGVNFAARNKTINRIQRLENALSGYYAAYGTYPPVNYHNSPNIYAAINNHGIQDDSEGENSNIWGWLDEQNRVKNSSAESAAWEQVKAACQAQPIGCYFPLGDDENTLREVQKYSERMKRYVQEVKVSDKLYNIFSAGFDTGAPATRFGSSVNKTDWTELQLFKFGLLSFLLPRYLFMMEGPEEFFTDFKQWTGNNQVPSDPYTGNSWDNGWGGLYDDAEDGRRKNGGTRRKKAINKLQAISSQAVCARWMANFEKTLSCVKPQSFFGINVTSPDMEDMSTDWFSGNRANLSLTIYAPPNSDTYSGQYILNSITIKDGWGEEFFYYSPPPYQSYLIWSAGPNKRTFPPWVDRSTLDSKANACIGYWVGDDIISLKK